MGNATFIERARPLAVAGAFVLAACASGDRPRIAQVAAPVPYRAAIPVPPPKPLPPPAPQALVTSRCFDALFHEILNEPESGPVFEELQRWLDARF